MTTKDDLHHLVDELDEESAREALAYLQTLRMPPFLRDAPVDDEPESQADRAAAQEAEQDIAAGRTLSHDAIRREFTE